MVTRYSGELWRGFRVYKPDDLNSRTEHTFAGVRALEEMLKRTYDLTPYGYVAWLLTDIRMDWLKVSLSFWGRELAVLFENSPAPLLGVGYIAKSTGFSN